MSTDKCIIVCDSIIHKPKPRKLNSHTSKRINKESFLKCPFTPSEELMKDSLIKKKEELFKSCNIEDIERDFSLLKEERIKKKQSFTYLRDSTRMNSFEEEQNNNYVEIERPQNPFYKNFD